MTCSFSDSTTAKLIAAAEGLEDSYAADVAKELARRLRAEVERLRGLVREAYDEGRCKGAGTPYTPQHPEFGKVLSYGAMEDWHSSHSCAALGEP